MIEMQAEGRLGQKIDRETFANKTDATGEIFSFIEGWYNPDRRH